MDSQTIPIEILSLIISNSDFETKTKFLFLEGTRNEAIKHLKVVESVVLGLKAKSWYDGKELRVQCLYYESGAIKRIGFYHNGVLDNGDDKPALISKYENGALEGMEWVRNGEYEREDDKPTIVTWYPNGVLRSELWVKEGLVDRIHKPAYIKYADYLVDGKSFVIYKAWWLQDQIIRKDKRNVKKKYVLYGENDFITKYYNRYDARNFARLFGETRTNTKEK